MSKKITELDESKLTKVSGGEKLRKFDGTTCPNCGGQLEGFSGAMSEAQVYKCTSCGSIFSDEPKIYT